MTTTGTTGYLLQASTLWLVFAAGNSEGRSRQATTTSTGRPSQSSNQNTLVDSQCNGKTLEMTASMDFQALQSPNHPRNYPNNAHCSWLLVAPGDEYKIKLHTYVLDMEWFPSCAYDNISIYDGYNESSQLLVTFCANFHIVSSSQRYMHVVFMSDKSSTGAGFDLRFNAQLINPPSPIVLSTTTTEDTTAANKGDSGRVNTWILIGSIVGGVCVIIIIGVVCGRCMSSRRTRHHRRPPPYRAAAFYHSHSPPELHPTGSSAEDGLHAMPASVHMVQNNNAVFMVSGATPGLECPTLTPSHFASLTSGVANLAFSGSTEYMAMTPTQGYLGPPIGVPPPSYTETMLMTHPPVIPPSPSRSYTGMHPTVSPTPSLGLSVPGSLAVPSGRPLNSSSAFTVLPTMSTPNIIIHANGAQMHPHMDANQNGHVACIHQGQFLPPPLSEDYTTHNSSSTCFLPPIPQSVVTANPFAFSPSENAHITRYFPSAASTSLGSVPYNYAPQSGAIPGLFPPVVCQELQTTPVENQLSQAFVSSSGDMETNPESYSTVEEIHQNLDSAMHVAMETERPLTTSCSFSVQDNEQASEHRPFADQRGPEGTCNLSNVQTALCPNSSESQCSPPPILPVDPSLSLQSLRAPDDSFQGPQVQSHGPVFVVDGYRPGDYDPGLEVCLPHDVDDMGASQSHHNIEAEMQGYGAAYQSSTFWQNSRAAGASGGSRPAPTSHFHANPETGSSNPSPTTLAALEEDGEQGPDEDELDFPDPPEFVLRPCLLEPETGIPCVRPVQPVPTSIGVLYALSAAPSGTPSIFNHQSLAYVEDCQENPIVPFDDGVDDEGHTLAAPLVGPNVDEDLGASEATEDEELAQTTEDHSEPVNNEVDNDLSPPSPSGPTELPQEECLEPVA